MLIDDPEAAWKRRSERGSNKVGDFFDLSCGFDHIRGAWPGQGPRKDPLEEGLGLAVSGTPASVPGWDVVKMWLAFSAAGGDLTGTGLDPEAGAGKGVGLGPLPAVGQAFERPAGRGPELEGSMEGLPHIRAGGKDRFDLNGTKEAREDIEGMNDDVLDEARLGPALTVQADADPANGTAPEPFSGPGEDGIKTAVEADHHRGAGSGRSGGDAAGLQEVLSKRLFHEEGDPRLHDAAGHLCSGVHGRYGDNGVEGILAEEGLEIGMGLGKSHFSGHGLRGGKVEIADGLEGNHFRMVLPDGFEGGEVFPPAVASGPDQSQSKAHQLQGDKGQGYRVEV